MGGFSLSGRETGLRNTFVTSMGAFKHGGGRVLVFSG